MIERLKTQNPVLTGRKVNEVIEWIGQTELTTTIEGRVNNYNRTETYDNGWTVDYLTDALYLRGHIIINGTPIKIQKLIGSLSTKLSLTEGVKNWFYWDYIADDILVAVDGSYMDVPIQYLIYEQGFIKFYFVSRDIPMKEIDGIELRLKGCVLTYKIPYVYNGKSTAAYDVETGSITVADGDTIYAKGSYSGDTFSLSIDKDGSTSGIGEIVIGYAYNPPICVRTPCGYVQAPCHFHEIIACKQRTLCDGSHKHTAIGGTVGCAGEHVHQIDNTLSWHYHALSGPHAETTCVGCSTLPAHKHGLLGFTCYTYAFSAPVCTSCVGKHTHTLTGLCVGCAGSLHYHYLCLTCVHTCVDIFKDLTIVCRKLPVQWEGAWYACIACWNEEDAAKRPISILCTISGEHLRAIATIRSANEAKTGQKPTPKLYVVPLARGSLTFTHQLLPVEGPCVKFNPDPPPPT